VIRLSERKMIDASLMYFVHDEKTGKFVSIGKVQPEEAEVRYSSYKIKDIFIRI
jgi:hypothetical protein